MAVSVHKDQTQSTRAWTLTANPHEIQRWRQKVAETLRRWGASREAIDLACLGVSELLSNVIKHVDDPRCLLRVRRVGERVVVQLVDRSPTPPSFEAPDWDSESGRGLWMLREMCAQFGWEKVPSQLGAKCVWFSCALTNEVEPP